MERRERVFIHGLVKSSRHARSSGTLILANSTGDGVQHCPFLVVLVLKHRLTGHTLPPTKLSRQLGFPPKEAWAHRQRGNSVTLPQVPLWGWCGNWCCGLYHGAFPSAARMQLVQTGRAVERLHQLLQALPLLLVGYISLHQLRTLAELDRQLTYRLLRAA